MATGRTDPNRNDTGGSDGRDGEPTDQRPSSVSPEALTCRLRSAVGEAQAVTLRVQQTEFGSEVERVLHAEEALTTTTELDHHVTLACARVLVTELPGAASDVRLVRPTLRTCDADDAVAHDVKLPVLGAFPVNVFGGSAARNLKKAIAARWIADVASPRHALDAWDSM